ncbi:MAG: RsmB/NOP family class I SAM-dependent RNA methyltransferase [Candidatus Nezhaarchaeota archaeon]|nr:RsmB/NOP family class I SAM-dependent RNA methyltransferase [Candidatus Nezhaarchaeota archaeon]
MKLGLGWEESEGTLSYFATFLGKSEAVELLRSLRTPPSKYFLRVNTLLAHPEDLVKWFKDAGFEAKPYSIELPEAIYLETEEQDLDEAEAQGLKEVIVDRFTAESVLTGADVYIPGLKRMKNVLKGERVAIKSEDEGLVAIGVANVSSSDLICTRRGLAIKVIKSKFKVPSLRSTEPYRLGLIYPQSLPSMISVRALEVKPGQRLIDLTAAPGGKVSHAYQLMRGEGLIVAVDRSKKKVERLEENLMRMKMSNVRVLQRDSRYLDLELPNEYFDVAMVDPPCSALGVRPRLKIELSLSFIKSLAEYQKQFIKVAARLIRKGGRILYSTCTLTIEENESVVNDAEKELGLLVCQHEWLYGSPSLLHGEQRLYARRFYPHLHDTPGFFYAILEKQKA